MISTFRFLLLSLYHYRRSAVATALGVIVATTVFTGVFLVGHSMRASLRDLALDAIGSIDYAILAPHTIPFSGRTEFDVFDKSEQEQDTPEQNVELRSTAKQTTAVGVILLEGTLESVTHRVRSVKIHGIPPHFWTFWKSFSGGGCPRVHNEISRSQAPSLNGRNVILNRATADALQVKPGDSILVRLPRLQEVPAESVFGHKDQNSQPLRLKVDRIIPDQGPGRFTLNPSQHAPMVAYLPLETLQQRLDMPGKVNAILLADGPPQISTFAELGLHVEQPQEGEPDATFLAPDRMLFLPGSEAYLTTQIHAAKSSIAIQPVLTYLANSISLESQENAEIPYSTVTAYDFDDSALPGGPLKNDEIALNAWTADQLGAKPGDTITLRYFRPDSQSYAETTHTFRLVAILPMSGVAVDRRWTPRVEGITDELTMADWDPPFPFDAEKIRPQDETYWDEYRATPKAFVSYATGKRLWGSRLGNATSLRIAPPMETGELDAMAKQLDSAPFGLAIQDVRRRALDASVGTTSFEGLFLALSFFVIASALILVALMFRLGVDARAKQIGLLAAIGFSRRRIAMLLVGEGLIVAVFGSLVGVVLGVWYARLLIFGLSTWWLGAIGTPFLTLHVAFGTLLLGFMAGTLTSGIVITLSLRRLMRISPTQLLAGRTERHTRYDRLRTKRRIAWAVVLNLWTAVLAILLAYFTIGIDARYETLTFFGSGILALMAALATVRLWLLLSAERPMLTAKLGNRLRFATRGAARHPMRSMAIVGMMAATVFLVVSIGAFRIGPVENELDPSGPTGGFQLVGQSDLPIYGEFDQSTEWEKFGFTPEEKKLLDKCRFVSMRVSSGDNASCLNLFRPGRPQILGVSDLGSFTQKRDLPHESWLVQLDRLSQPNKDKRAPLSNEDENRPIGVALEKNVANYSFQLWGGVGEKFEVATDSDRPLELEVGALLGPTPFLGNLLIPERDFRQLFPDVGGYRFFLISTPKGKEEAVRALLERVWGDYGFSAERTTDRLASVSVVQNTYLATFQSLGGLGLLLGLFGLLAVEVRNVMERRGELALLDAIGFQRRTLLGLLTLENGLLLIAGLVSGLASSLVAILPHLTDATANVPIPLLASILALTLLITLLGLPPTAALALRHIHPRDIQQDS